MARDEEVARAAKIAQKVGAPDNIQFAGIGQFGIVFCDPDELIAWKVYRRNSDLRERYGKFLREHAEDEYDFLVAAQESEVSGSVVKPIAFHPKDIVLERECVAGRPGTWGDGKELTNLFREIAQAMEPLGWGAPEYKEDSFIYEEGTGKPVLVDAGMARRLGPVMLEYVEDVLDGKRETADNLHTLAFYLIQEYSVDALSADQIKPVMRRLVAIDPSIKEGFSAISRLI